MTKSVFVTLAGHTNAGKSSLLNAIIGEKIASVSGTKKGTNLVFVPFYFLCGIAIGVVPLTLLASGSFVQIHSNHLLPYSHI